ncbi:MAG TPA: magnesium/cobalt transporter CorA, partial [Bacteroidia bacterium]|nr:magnesium/cobalt transporter CorA [Bacteroidia bacterium]
IRSFIYDLDDYTETELKSISEIKDQIASKTDKIHWIDIKGFGDKYFLEQLADCFGIHRLQMEDVVNVYQRPKVEDYKDHLFLISRVMREKDMQLINDQLSLFVGRNFVITLQDKYEDILDPVRDRIRHGKGFVRRYGADYLGYALMDVVLDNYYPILEQLGERLDELQDLLIMNPTRDALNKVLQIKRELIVLRRSIWSERDKINDILRSAFPNVTDTTKVFFRDSYDHCIQILDLVESYKEVTASLMDVYHSSVSNRLNQVMKVLTIISTIFIPLTFIVGLYGMNFAHLNPKTGEPLPLNMPELYSPYGYLSVCIAMVLIVIGQIYFFYKKGWLTKG